MPDKQIARLLNRAGKPTGRGNGWTEVRVRSFRHHHEIAVFRPGEWAGRGEITLEAAAKIIGVTPEAITSVFPQTVVQTCIVHLIRNSLAFVSWKERKAILPAIKAIYRAENADMALLRLEEFEAAWGKRYPAIGQMWRRAWEHVVPFFAFAPSVRKMIYTTNAVEALHRSLRKIIKTRGSFPTMMPPSSCFTWPSKMPACDGAGQLHGRLRWGSLPFSSAHVFLGQLADQKTEYQPSQNLLTQRIGRSPTSAAIPGSPTTPVLWANSVMESRQTTVQD
jgi:hypothetical protein